MDISKLNALLGKGFAVTRRRDHGKASESYVDVTITHDDGSKWEGSIPFQYRRTGLNIETEEDLAEYLISIRHYFSKTHISEFVRIEKARWEPPSGELSGKETTKGFFNALLSMKWVSVESDCPRNPNWARRIQDIKEFGYTLATNTNVPGKTGTYLLLLPIPKGGASGYEVISPALKERIIDLLNGINAYENSVTNRHGLIPDHKFPEIRWDEDTREVNDDATSSDLISKFQLLDNQRNQQKREMCRACYQTGKRGIAFGIEYFYLGTINWPSGTPKNGRDAEEGCKGCAWYDMQKWRASLNNFLRSNKK